MAILEELRLMIPAKLMATITDIEVQPCISLQKIGALLDLDDKLIIISGCSFFLPFWETKSTPFVFPLAYTSTCTICILSSTFLPHRPHLRGPENERETSFKDVL